MGVGGSELALFRVFEQIFPQFSCCEEIAAKVGLMLMQFASKRNYDCEHRFPPLPGELICELVPLQAAHKLS